jgi:glycosyltransferase involved in cell wall biosynthesis
MKIGVIVSTYNRPDALVKVMTGLMNQSRRPDEIIVADDGSTDATRQAINPFLEKKKPGCIHVWQTDDGFRLSKIRNEAIKASQSDYLVFLDGDCIPHCHFIKDHGALAKPGCFFQGKRVIVSQQASPLFEHTHTRSFLHLVGCVMTGKISNGHHIIRLPFLPAYTTKKMSGIRGCNMGFYKSDLLAVNGFNQAFKGWGREDSEIVARLYNYGIRRREHPFMAICYHLWHPENTRSRMDENDRLLDQALASNQYYCKKGINDEPV